MVGKAEVWCREKDIDVNSSLQDAAHPFVRHALQVRRALALGDCMQVCELYRSTPNMGRAIMDTVLPRVRLAAVKILAKAYLPHLPVPVIASRLAFVKSESGPKQTPEMPPPSVSALSLPGSTKATFAGAHSTQAWLEKFPPNKSPLIFQTP